MKAKLWTVFACAMAMVSSAHAKTWGDYIVGGTACNSGNVSVIDSGTSLSVLFDSFGVNMPSNETGDGLSQRKTCNFRIALTPPTGYYLAGFKQVYNGGLIKSRRASAQLNIRYNIGTVQGQPLPIVWREGAEISPADASSLFSRTYYNDLLVASCGGSTTYGINMQFSALRRGYSEYLVGVLDSVDADFVQRLVLIPEWRLCRR